MTDALRGAVDAMREVRDRCVWTQQITHRDLVPYLIEESAEAVDAIETGSRAELREELGDLLWQVLFHAEIASRDSGEPFDIDDVARELTDKMVRRHPHVFAGETAETPEQVLVLWNAAKAAEKHERRSVLDGVSERMPSLAHAQKLLGRAAAAGLTSNQGNPVETGDTAPGLAENPRSRGGTAVPPESHGGGEGGDGEGGGGGGPASEDELGDALLALVTVARERGWNAERAMRERNRRLSTDIRSAEADAGG